jgi:signal transduction histidine kinase
VFDLFTQAERPLDRAQGGLGVGLTLVKVLIEMHGGTVEARNASPESVREAARWQLSTRWDHSSPM